MPSIAALFADGPFDLVMIGSPNHLHYEHLLAAFEAGYPIFAEKPIVRTEEETFALARHLASKTIPPLHIGLVMRSMPIVRETIRASIPARSASSCRWTRPSICRRNMAPIWRATGGARRNGAAPTSSTRCATISISSAASPARAPRASQASAAGAFSIQPARTCREPTATARRPMRMRDAGWAGANDAFHSDMDVADHQTAIVEYASGLRLSFHSNSHVSLGERRWYIAGTEGTLIADLVRNKLMVRARHGQGEARAHRLCRSHRRQPQRRRPGHGDRSARLARGPRRVSGDARTIRWKLASPSWRSTAPCANAPLIDCTAMWDDYDAARGAVSARK